jgi:teichuronic acid biosynthesis glycosyltransferase TuaG
VNGPQFSVILPVYNGFSVVGRAVESVISQTDPDWELLCIDDGSTDSSLELLYDAVRRDTRIRVLRTANSGGPARPRNAGIAEAVGRAVCFLDQDDYWLPEKLARQRSLLERTDVGVVYADAWVEETDHGRRLYSDLWGRGSNGEVARDLIRSNFIPALTAVVPTGVARSVGPLDERLVGVDDYHWWLRIATAGYQVFGVPEPLAVYSVTGSNLSRDHDLYLKSLDACLRDMARRRPLYRPEFSARKEAERLHAFDYFANRLAAKGIRQPGGLRTAIKVGGLVRGWPEAKRAVASALPPAHRPHRGRRAD